MVVFFNEMFAYLLLVGAKLTSAAVLQNTVFGEQSLGVYVPFGPTAAASFRDPALPQTWWTSQSRALISIMQIRTRRRARQLAAGRISAQEMSRISGLDVRQ